MNKMVQRWMTPRYFSIAKASSTMAHGRTILGHNLTKVLAVYEIISRCHFNTKWIIDDEAGTYPFTGGN